MTQEDLFEILAEVDEQYIVEAEEPVKKSRLSRKKLVFAVGLAAVACLCLFMFGGREIELSRSKGVRVSYTRFLPGIGSEACLVYLTEEELFTKWSDVVFKGTVTKIDNIKLSFNGSTNYRALAEVQVEKVYRGTCEEGETIRMLLPGAVSGNIHSSIMDTLGELKVGMTGIFMPMAYGIDSVYQSNGATLYLGELAPYGFGDGIRFAFLETEEGLVFSRDAYVGAKDASTLEEIEVYVEQMLELYFGEDAADSAQE